MDLQIDKLIMEALFNTKLLQITDTVRVDANGESKRTASGNLIYEKIPIPIGNVLYSLDSLGMVYVVKNRQRQYLQCDKGDDLRIEDGAITFSPLNGSDNQPGNRISIKKFGRLFEGIHKLIGDKYNYNKAELISDIVESINAAVSIQKGLTTKVINNPSELYTVKLFGTDSLGSCMSEAHNPNYSARENLVIYDRIEECQGIIFYKENEPIGRCLLWERRYYDTLYTINSSARAIIKNYLEKSDDWISLQDGIISINVTDLKVTKEDFPYIDNVCTLLEKVNGDMFLINSYVGKYLDRLSLESYDYETTELRDIGVSIPIKKCIVSDSMDAENLIALNGGTSLYALSKFVTVCPISGNSELTVEFVTVTHGSRVGQLIGQRSVVGLSSSLYNRQAHAVRGDCVLDSDYDYIMKEDAVSCSWVNSYSEKRTDIIHFSKVILINGMATPICELNAVSTSIIVRGIEVTIKPYKKQ